MAWFFVHILIVNVQLPFGRSSRLHEVRSLNDQNLSTQDASDLFVLAQLECDKHVWMDQNRLSIYKVIASVLQFKRPDVHYTKIREAVQKAEETRQAKAMNHIAPATISVSLASQSHAPMQQPLTSQATTLTAHGHDLTTDQGLKAWVHHQYAQAGFSSNGQFKGYPHLKMHLKALTETQPKLEARTFAALST